MNPRGISLILALIAGGVLLWSWGPAGSDDSGSDARATSLKEKKAVRLEQRLARNPSDKGLLLATMEAWIGAGDGRLSMVDRRTQPIPSAVAEDYRAGLEAWRRHLDRTGGKAAVDIAARASLTLFALVEIGSRDLGEIEANVEEAIRAQRIVCKRMRDLHSLSTLAQYEYFNGEFAAGDRAATAAAADVATSPNLKYVKQQLRELRERGESFLAKVRRAARELQESGSEELETPLRGFANAAAINISEEDDPYG